MIEYSSHFDPRHISNNRYPRLSRGNSKRFRKIAIGIIALLILFFVGKFFIGAISGIFQRGPSVDPKVAGETVKNPDTLLAEIETITEDIPGTFSVYIYDIQNSKGFGMNENMVFTAASINKIPILASLYHLAGIGEIDLEDTITPQEIDIQDYGTGSIRYDPTGTTYSIRTLARLMIEKSDNTAGHLLGKIVIETPNIQELIESWGLTQTDMENNKTTNSDMQILLTKMYKGEITTPELTPEMLGLMKRSDFDDRLPKGLPEGTTIYHKTGDEVAKIHDVGIVEKSGSPYYIGIFTTDMRDEAKAKKTISEISRLVFEFFQAASNH